MAASDFSERRRSGHIAGRAALALQPTVGPQSLASSQIAPSPSRVRNRPLTARRKSPNVISLNKYVFHFEDGPEKVKRDQEMRQVMHGEEGVNKPNQWADKKKTVELVGYYVDKAVDEWSAERGEKEIRKVVDSGAEAARRWLQQAEARL